MSRRKKPTARLEGSVSSAGGFRPGRMRPEAVLDQAAPKLATAEELAELTAVNTALQRSTGVTVTAQNTARLANPVPGDDGEALERITASFAQRFPKEWGEWALCPLRHGLEAMAALMKGKG